MTLWFWICSVSREDGWKILLESCNACTAESLSTVFRFVGLVSSTEGLCLTRLLEASLLCIDLFVLVFKTPGENEMFPFEMAGFFHGDFVGIVETAGGAVADACGENGTGLFMLVLVESTTSN